MIASFPPSSGRHFFFFFWGKQKKKVHRCNPLFLTSKLTVNARLKVLHYADICSGDRDQQHDTACALRCQHQAPCSSVAGRTPAKTTALIPHPWSYSLDRTEKRLHRPEKLREKENLLVGKTLHLYKWCVKYINKAVISEMYADVGIFLLTRAVDRKAYSPGWIGLVLLQFICRCVQHHQEKKSGPQRHCPLSARDTTKCTETLPALCAVHKNERSWSLGWANLGWNK